MVVVRSDGEETEREGLECRGGSGCMWSAVYVSRMIFLVFVCENMGVLGKEELTTYSPEFTWRRESCV